MRKHHTATELLNDLARQGRLQKVGQVLPTDRPLTFNQVQRVQDDLRFILDQPGVTMEQVGRAIDTSRGTVSRFVNLESADDCTGETEKHARKLNAWLETLGRRRATKNRRPEGFIETEVARRMLAVVAKTNELCSIGLIMGDSGRGKTLTLEAAQLMHPGSILLRVRQSSKRPRGFAAQLGKALGLRGCESIARAEDRIIEALHGTGRLLLVDESHQLSTETLEFIRDLHDECGMPIVLAGTVKLNEAISASDMYSGQLSSRVAIRYDITADLNAGIGGGNGPRLHSVEEIQRMYESSKLRLTDDGRELLTRIANLPGLGGLRLCTKLVQVASAARADESAPVDARLLLKVLRSLHGRRYAIATVEQAVADAAAVAVA